MKFIYRPSVKTDLFEAIDYYKIISPHLATQFIKRIRETKNLIAKNPLAFSVKYNNTRTALLRQFPYHIHFAINEKNEIIVYAIICAYKNPKDYSDR